MTKEQIRDIAEFCIYNSEYDEENGQKIGFSVLAEQFGLEINQITENIESVRNEILGHSGISSVDVNDSDIVIYSDEETDDFINEELEYTEQEAEDDELLDEVIAEETQKGNQDLFELTSNPNLSQEQKAKKMTNIYLLVLKKYFQKECVKDPYFKNKYKAELLEQCWDYCQKQAQKKNSGNVAMIKSYTIFSLAKAYFDDEIYIKEKKEKEEKMAKLEKERKERELKAEQDRIAKELKEKEKAEKERKEKEREEQWQKFLAKDDTCTLSEAELNREKFAHLKQQDLFDF